MGRRSGSAAGKPPVVPTATAASTTFNELTDRDANAITRDVGGAQSLSAAEIATVLDYTASGYASINSDLRNGVNTDPRIARLDAAIDRHTLPQNMVLWRGVGTGPNGMFLLFDTPVGSVISDKAFQSTSMVRDTAFDGVKLRINARKGAKALVLGNEATRTAYGHKKLTYHDEQEVILGRNARMRVDRIDVDNETVWVTLL